MSQNDFNIANQGFPQFRSDLNSALQALASTSAGATAPGTTYAYQLWYDTSTNLLKMRNADNDGFITLAAFDQAADEWEVRTAVVQAVDSAGVVIKTDDGVARISIADSGAVSIGGSLDVDTDTLFVDSANNRVGVGTSSPSTRFEANTGASGTQDIATVRSSNVQLKIGTTDIGNGQATYNVFPTANPAASSEHIWQSGGTEIMRLDTSRNLLVGTTSSPVSAKIASSFLSSLSQFGAVFIDSQSNNTAIFAQFRNASTAIGSITNNNNTGVSYNTSSDYRLKENVVPLSGAADRLAQIPVHRFNFIADPDRTVDGFLAHEVQEFVPECVTGEKDAVDADGNPVYQGIDQSKLVPLLTAALQEALAKIDALEARVAALESA